MRDHLKKAQQRATQYWFVDGLVELGGGVIGLLLSAAFVMGPAAFRSRWSVPVFFLAALAVTMGLRWVIQRIKERDTYPYTGYVAPLSGWENKRTVAATLLFTLLLLAVNLYLTLRAPQSLLWSPAAGGLAFALVFAWTAYLAAPPRFYFLALFCLLAGGALAISGLGYLPSMGILCGLIGLVLVAFGGLTRRAYLRHIRQLLAQPDER